MKFRFEPLLFSFLGLGIPSDRCSRHGGTSLNRFSPGRQRGKGEGKRTMEGKDTVVLIPIQGADLSTGHRMDRGVGSRKGIDSRPDSNHFICTPGKGNLGESSRWMNTSGFSVRPYPLFLIPFPSS